MTTDKRSRGEILLFSTALAIFVGAFFCESLFLGKILSPADVLLVGGAYDEIKGPNYEPANRLLIDPALQFQPWIAFNREQLRAGRLPLWNPFVGCGAPHLANGQSSVFDPFLLIAYLGPLPRAFAWTAAARLWFAGLGMFLLMRRWEAGRGGSWFAGLTFPFCGFLVVWLQYPVTSAAVWLPWILWTTDRLREKADAARVAWLAATVAGCLLGGHIQTSAHVLLFAGLYVLWRAVATPGGRRSVVPWGIGAALGILIAAIEIVPLGFYLARSPVWTDRAAERIPPWSFDKPRVLDAVCFALPYAYGSQRRGHPNLAKALGVHNLNESAGGFAGLATLLWLAPAAWTRRRERPVVAFLFATAAAGILGSLRLPPIDNILRSIPVINVTDNRRLSFWCAFALCALGGFGLETLRKPATGRSAKGATIAWVLMGLVCLIPPLLVGRFEGRVREFALKHYRKAAEATPGADPKVFEARALRQTNDLLKFVPRYYATAAFQLFGMAALLALTRFEQGGPRLARRLVAALVVVDLFGFGWGLNPAIAPEDHAPSSDLIRRLQAEPPGRTLAIGAELPPNSLMRYGLRDLRNYDSMEFAPALDWLSPLFEASEGGSRSSRREVGWSGVSRAFSRLIDSGTTAIVAPTAPPDAIERIDVSTIGPVFLVRIPGKPLYEPKPTQIHPGEFVWDAPKAGVHVVREMAAPGWRAWVDDVEVPLAPATVDPFLRVVLGADARRLRLKYDPIEVRIAVVSSLFGLGISVFALTLPPLIRSTRIVRARLGRNRAAGLRS